MVASPPSEHEKRHNAHPSQRRGDRRLRDPGRAYAGKVSEPLLFDEFGYNDGSAEGYLANFTFKDR